MRACLGLAGVWLLPLLLLPARLTAQQADTTLRQYDLSEIVVREDEAQAGRVATVQRVGLAQLTRLNPATAADVTRLIPGAHLQVNSRGEALVYLRGASERQVALFLEGLPLNVPWDARFDLSLVPAGLLGEVEVTKGPFSVLYGSNSAGGVVDLHTKQVTTPGRLVEGEAFGGWPERGGGSALYHHVTPRVQLDAGIGGYAQRGDALPAGADVPFSQPDGKMRTNTDRAQVGALVRLGVAASERTRLSFTGLMLDAAKGVPPEGHLDPATESVRFWRYPQIRLGLLGLAAEHQREDGWLLRAQTWSALFAQHIDQFADATYASRTAAQQDGDYTHGMRLSARRSSASATFHTMLLLSTSLHRQRDGRPADAPPLQRYRQHLGTLAVEASQRFGAWALRAGAAYDMQATPLTDDKPGRGPQHDWSAAGGLTWHVSEALGLRVGLSRKVRFPTPREQFGTALNQFLLNPDLRPESIQAAEAAVVWQARHHRVEATFFAHRTDDAIDQRTVVVEGRRLRQRVNLEGSRVSGVEFAGAGRFASWLRLEGHLTLLRARARFAGQEVPLAEKPSLTALLVAEARLTSGVRAALDVSRIAGAVALERDGRWPRLPGASLVGANLSHLLRIRTTALTSFVRLDNAFGTAHWPQEGLPAAGRSVTLGFRFQY